MQLPSRYRSIRPAHGSLAEALENRRRLAGRLRQAASPLSAATGFRGAEACLQRNIPCPASLASEFTLLFFLKNPQLAQEIIRHDNKYLSYQLCDVGIHAEYVYGKVHKPDFQKFRCDARADKGCKFF